MTTSYATAMPTRTARSNRLISSRPCKKKKKKPVREYSGAFSRSDHDMRFIGLPERDDSFAQTRGLATLT